MRGCESTDKRKGKGNGKDMCKPISEINYSNDYDCALKIIDKNTFCDHVKKGKERVDTLAREVAIQMELTAQEQTSSHFYTYVTFSRQPIILSLNWRCWKERAYFVM